jgi:hypothetical protein
MTMRDTVLYMRGPVPFGLDAGISSALVRDARVFLELSKEQLEQCGSDLRNHDGFLDRAALELLFAARIENKEHVHRLARFISAIDTRFRRFGENASVLVPKIRDWLSQQEGEDAKLLSNDDLVALEQLLPVLLHPFPGLNRQAKAERLSKATGLPLEDIQLICDLRPVFDEDHANVEGMMPYTTLRIVCEGPDGLPLCLESVLTRKQVALLLDRVREADKKLTVLLRMLENARMPVPSTFLTTDKDQ